MTDPKFQLQRLNRIDADILAVIRCHDVPSEIPHMESTRGFYKRIKERVEKSIEDRKNGVGRRLADIFADERSTFDGG